MDESDGKENEFWWVKGYMLIYFSDQNFEGVVPAIQRKCFKRRVVRWVRPEGPAPPPLRFLYSEYDDISGHLEGAGLNLLSPPPPSHLNSLHSPQRLDFIITEPLNIK